MHEEETVIMMMAEYHFPHVLFLVYVQDAAR